MNRFTERRQVRIVAAASVAILLAMFAAVSLDAGSASVNPKAITLGSVMDKLESLQSQMQENVRATEAMRAALAQQRNLNGRLLHLLAAGGSTPAPMLMAAATPSPEPQRLRARGLKWAIQLCGKLGLGLEGTYGQKLAGDVGVIGTLGADVYGNGATGEVTITAAGEYAWQVGPAAGLEATACLEGIELDAVGAENLVMALTAGAPQAIDGVSNAFLSLPLLHIANLGNPISAVQNLQVNVGSGQLLDRLKQPATMFQDFQSFTTSMPFPGNVGAGMSNPASLFPTINDFDLNAMCSNTQAGTLFDDHCARARSFTNPLLPITNVLSSVDMKVDNFISGLNGVTSNVTSLQTGVTGVCNGINSRFATIRSGVVSFPARNFTLDLGFVGTFSIPVDIPLNAQPFSGLSGIGCPAF